MRAAVICQLCSPYSNNTSSKVITEVCFDLLVNEIKEEIVLRICIWILTLILQCDIYFKESHKDGRNQCLLPREDLATLTTKKLLLEVC